MNEFKLPKLRDYDGDTKKRWCVYYSVWIEDKFERKVEWISSKYDRKRRYLEAEKLIKQFTDRLEKGDPELFKSKTSLNQIDKNSFPILDMINRAFDYKKSYFSERSKLTYDPEIKRLKDWIKKKNLQKSDIRFFTQIHANLFFEETYLNRKYKLGGKTLNNYISIFRTIFDRIIKISPLEQNPFKIEAFKETEPEIVIWEEKYVIKLVSYLKENEPKMFAVLLLVYHCFLRTNEIRLLQLKDIDLKRGILTVTAKKGKGVLVKHPTLSEQLIEILAEIKSKGYPETYYIFSYNLEPGKIHLSRNTISARFNKIRKTLNIPEDHKLYNFKHTGNSEFAEMGLDIRAQQRQNGHTSPLITEKYIKRLSFTANENIKKLQKRL